MVLVTLATINPNAENAAEPTVTSRKIAQRLPQDCMCSTHLQTRISMVTEGTTRM